MLDVPSAVVVSVKTARGVKAEEGEEETGEETTETGEAEETKE